VPGDMTVNDSHALCDRIEEALLKRLGHATITIHVEPDSQSAAPAAGLMTPMERTKS